MIEGEVFAPWRLVASFADGSRLLFDGLTEQQAKAAMESAQREHGCISWWDHVTDLNYEDGRYYRTTPEPPTIHVLKIDECLFLLLFMFLPLPVPLDQIIQLFPGLLLFQQFV